MELLMYLLVGVLIGVALTYSLLPAQEKVVELVDLSQFIPADTKVRALYDTWDRFVAQAPPSFVERGILVSRAEAWSILDALSAEVDSYPFYQKIRYKFSKRELLYKGVRLQLERS